MSDKNEMTETEFGHAYDDAEPWDAGNTMGELQDDHIPRYDDLELEGRTRTYGSREEYNTWRNEQIRFFRMSGYYPAEKKINPWSDGCFGIIILAVVLIVATMILFG